MTLATILDELPALKTPELKRIVIAANKLMKQPQLYIREVGKTEGNKQRMYLYAMWNEDGEARKKSLGPKCDEDGEGEFGRIGVATQESAEFLREMQAVGYRIIA